MLLGNGPLKMLFDRARYVSVAFSALIVEGILPLNWFVYRNKAL